MTLHRSAEIDDWHDYTTRCMIVTLLFRMEDGRAGFEKTEYSGVLDPIGEATRAEAATIFVRFDAKLGNKA